MLALDSPPPGPVVPEVVRPVSTALAVRRCVVVLMDEVAVTHPAPRGVRHERCPTRTRPLETSRHGRAPVGTLLDTYL